MLKLAQKGKEDAIQSETLDNKIRNNTIMEMCNIIIKQFIKAQQQKIGTKIIQEWITKGTLRTYHK